MYSKDEDHMKTIAVALLVSGLAASFVHGKDFTVSPVEGDATATLQKAFGRL